MFLFVVSNWCFATSHPVLSPRCNDGAGEREMGTGWGGGGGGVAGDEFSFFFFFFFLLFFLIGVLRQVIQYFYIGAMMGREREGDGYSRNFLLRDAIYI